MSINSELQVNKKTIRIIKGDITKRNVDAIVNAANSHLQHGGGVAAAIVRNGGSVIQEESNKIGFVPVSGAVVTTAGRLPCKAVIHTVGPKIGEGDEDSKLTQSIINVLRLAAQKEFSSISVPAISSGIFGFPKDRCAKILIGESKRFLEESQNISIQIIEFCLLDDEALYYFEKEMDLLKKDI